jgi:hypothetical protein
MVTFVSGSTTSASTETDLFSVVTADSYHACLVFLHNLTVTEVMVFRVYVRDDNTSTNRVYLTQTVSGASIGTDVALYFAPIATRTFRITVQRTAGTDRAIPWTRSS